MALGIKVAAAAVFLVGTLTSAVQAASFGTDGLRFDRNTRVNFSFFESHGSYQSSLDVYEVSNGGLLKVGNLFNEVKGSDNGGANEWKGSFGNAVTSSTGKQTVSFDFLSGRNYTLGLSSLSGGRNAGIVYSTTALNPFTRGGTQQAVFGTNLPNELNRETTNSFRLASQRTSGDPFGSQPVFISFDDRGNRNDTDFQDFTVSAVAEQAAAVPEPTTMGAMGVAIVGLLVSRRSTRRTA